MHDPTQMSREMIALMQKENKLLFELWENAVANGENARPRYMLSQALRCGEGAERNETLESTHLSLAAMHADVEAMFTLGTYAEMGYILDANISFAAARYRQAANKGHAEAANKLAWIQMFGAKDIPANVDMAKFRLSQAADEGHAFAMLYYADLIYEDKSDPKNKETAISLWKQAANFNLAEAKDRLLKIKEEKTEAETIYLNAKELHSKNESFISQMTMAARKGLAYAQYELGKALLPIRTEIYKATACSWLRAAAEQGHTDALHLLAQCYMQGTGVKQSVAKAIRLWETCLARGGRHAAYHLARIYERGIGVERDLKKALECFEKCYLWDDEYPVFERERCRDRLMLTD